MRAEMKRDGRTCGECTVQGTPLAMEAEMKRQESARGLEASGETTGYTSDYGGHDGECGGLEE